MSTRVFLGVDVSELNGHIDWQAMKNAGMNFAIIRLGWGNNHLDENFYENVNGALDAGMKIGVYYYSYALSDEQAGREADYCLSILNDCGVDPDLGIFIDMENDNYKSRNEFTNPQEITNAVSVFINRVWQAGKTPGVYSNYDWFTNKIYIDQLGGPLIWCAQYNDWCDVPNDMWQYTDSYNVGGMLVDGDEIREGSQLFHVMMEEA